MLTLSKKCETILLDYDIVNVTINMMMIIIVNVTINMSDDVIVNVTINMSDDHYCQCDN